MSTGNSGASAPAAGAPAQAAEAAVTPENASGTQEVAAEGEAPAVTPTKAEIKRLKALKIKVDGQEYDEALPFEIDDTPENKAYMTKQLQMARMANSRAQQAAELQKKVDAIGDYLAQAKGDKKKIRALIKELGADEKEIAAAVIEEEIENSKKSPEQLEKEKLAEELRELKEQREREKKSWEEREKERLYGEQAERYDMLVSKAIESSDLPKSPYVVKKMADYMLLGLENGVDVHPDDVINLVREEIQSDIQQMFAVMPEEVVEKLIGKDVLGKLRKKNVAKAKAGGTPPVPVKAAVKDVGAKSQVEEKPQAKKTIKQMWGV